MESVSIPTTPVSSFGSMSECMGSWIKCCTLRWYRVYLTSSLLENKLSIARNYFSSPESLNPCSVWYLSIHRVGWFFPPSLYITSTIAFVVCSSLIPVILSPFNSKPYIFSDWNFNLALLLLSPWIKWWQPCKTSLLYCISVCL